MNTEVSVIEYMLVDDDDGGLFIEVHTDRTIMYIIGPFETNEQRQYILNDLMQMMRELGAKDIPDKLQ